jgi:hypothetical protein
MKSTITAMRNAGAEGIIITVKKVFTESIIKKGSTIFAAAIRIEATAGVVLTTKGVTAYTG